MQRQTVERAIAGDHDAFALLAQTAIASMYATAKLIVRNDALAEDATQEALVNAWRYLPSLRDPDRFEAWLYRLLVNACRTQFRAGRRFSVVEIDVADANRGGIGSVGVDPGIAVADRDQLERGFRRLAADERAIVILRFYRGYSVPEVAEIMGIPLGTAKSRLHRATTALRAALDADGRLGSVAERSPA